MIKRFLTALLIITMIGSINTSVSACVEDVNLGQEGCRDCVHVDTLDLEIPAGEKLVEVKDDGSFITEVIEAKEELGEIEQETRSSCSRPELRYVITLFQKSSYNKKYSDKCYKGRYFDISRCVRCGREFRSYKNWVDYKHKYPLFGSECKECGFKKK